MIRFSACFAFLVSGFLFGASTHISQLNGGNEVPPVTTDARGAAIMSYNPITRELAYSIIHTVSEPTAAHIHGPAAVGVNAGVLHNLGDPTSPMSGVVQLSETDEADLYAGLLYFNIHSGAFPSGEIRGQIVGPGLLVSRLDGDQEVPPVATDAMGFSIMNYNQLTNTLAYAIVHTVVDPTAAHIHGPAEPGQNGGVAVGLTAAAPLISGEAVLTEQQEADLMAGLFYFNIHTAANPGGEIRGQIEPIALYGTVMSGLNEVPPVVTMASGVGVVLQQPARNAADYVFLHDVEGATAAHIHGPAPAGQNAGVVFDLGSPASPMIGALTLDDQQASDLSQDLYYVNVHSPSHPAGEVRGQLLRLASIQDLMSDYRLLLSEWATSQVNACFGSQVTIIEIQEFVANGLECPQ